MSKTIIRTVSVLAIGASMSMILAAQGADDLLPPNAKPGQCYARVFVPPTYSTQSENAVKHEAYKRQTVVPARYEWAEERILVKEASTRIEVVPATYGWAEERVLVKPASEKIVDVPAKFRTETERVMDRPAHTIWKKGTGPIQKVDNGTGEIMCLVEVPATYKTVTRRVLESPATSKKVEVPAQYKTIKRQVVKTPPTTRTVEVPAQYETVRVQKLVAAASIRETEVPAEYQTVSKTVQQSDGQLEWQPVLCETNSSPGLIRSLQSALKAKGLYNGPLDGIIGSGTSNAIQSFQRGQGLPVGHLTMETLQKLGVSMGG